MVFVEGAGLLQELARRLRDRRLEGGGRNVVLDHDREVPLDRGESRQGPGSRDLCGLDDGLDVDLDSDHAAFKLRGGENRRV